jgi:hypothetical protein
MEGRLAAARPDRLTGREGGEAEAAALACERRPRGDERAPLDRDPRGADPDERSLSDLHDRETAEHLTPVAQERRGRHRHGLAAHCSPDPQRRAGSRHVVLCN